ncbi:family 16 glycosylhydrolase [Siccirubricoccus deserti]|uniref:Family 16 glycosylhydrolase n=1 Tax=Siccirubricoccus deserti TaxID=2013562 RepID=A0A9X0R3B1_9PROT|nr:family 16 glycosylhydrolase [Siccirubricoccus deserti]MBC4017643.1 family 16 glycosylhydrolase [Siccirubricoccus deserti]
MADFVESFDNGVGALNHVWGNANIDTSVRGQVTISGATGGIMEKPSGASAGHGYGTYEVVAELHGDTEGSAALLWPGNDKWPGPEYDIVEVIHGRAYGAVHFESGGGDRYNVVNFDGIDESQVHTYTLDWQPGSITYYVDGERMGSVNEGIGADYANGGVNEVIGLMNRSHDTSITVYEVSYTASGASGGGSRNADNAVAQADAQDSFVPAGETSLDGQQSWWPAWEAAWNAHNYTDGNDDWQAEFWSTLASGGDIWAV